MKIIVISTGGTVAASGTSSGQGVKLRKNNPLFQTFDSVYYQFKPQFSENLTLEYLDQLRTYVLKVCKKKSDLLLILHGTDTVTYSAQLLNRTYKPDRPILFLTTQRSPDCPNWELAPILVMLQNLKFKRVLPKTYIINYKGPNELQLLAPNTCFKAYSFRKGCFMSYDGPEYHYHNSHLVHLRNIKRPYIPYKGFRDINIPILYVTPSMVCNKLAYTKFKIIILVGYGLGNLPNYLVAYCKGIPSTTFYVTNNLIGPKTSRLYNSEHPKNIIVSSSTIESLYLSLLLK